MMVLVPRFAIGEVPSGVKGEMQNLAHAYLTDFGPLEHVSAIGITVYTPVMTSPISVYAGISDPAQDPVNAESLFQIGSVAKSYIAALIVKLVENPNVSLDLDTPIDVYLPQYPRWHGITVRQLLNMTSGIPDYLKDPSVLTQYAKTPNHFFNANIWVDQMYQRSLLFPPGTQFNYSNTNYLLLAMIIEKITGHRVADEIKQQFITPLNLKHTFYVTHKPNALINAHLVHGYQYEEGLQNYIPLGTDVTHDSLSYMQAAGGIIANNEDAARWLLMLFTPGKVLSSAALKSLTTIYDENGQPIRELSPSHPNGYGLGISMQYSAKLKTTIYIYQGMTLGYRAFYVYVPTKSLLILVTVNSSYAGGENHLVQLVNAVGHVLAADKS